MASVVLSNVGSVLGNNLIPSIGGRILGTLGRRAGNALDRELGLSSSGDTEGPRLENLRVQDSCYGKGLPQVFGRMRVAGNFIWASELIETRHENATNASGKSGASSIGATTRTTYSYSLHCAIAIAAGEIGGIDTIWADSKVIYQNGAWNDGLVAGSTIYNGSMEQEPDPFMEAAVGAGQVPAYKGVAYLVIEGLQLASFGSRLPNLTFEVLPKASSVAPLGLGEILEDRRVPETSLEKGLIGPLVLSGTASRVQKVLTGGVVKDGALTAFQIGVYDVTGNAPVRLSETTSDYFTMYTVQEQNWALSPDKHFVVMQAVYSALPLRNKLILFDTETNSFGPLFEANLNTTNDITPVAWLDELHFMVPDCVGGHRGVRVFTHAGLDIVDLGFFDVWGTAARRAFTKDTFVPVNGGVLHFVADDPTFVTAVYGCALVWQNGALTVGAPFTVATGLTIPVGVADQSNILPAHDDTYVLFIAATVSFFALSFRVSAEGVTVTRPWQMMVDEENPVQTCCVPLLFGDRVVIVRRADGASRYRMGEILLGDGVFTFTGTQEALNLNYAEMYFSALRLDGQRLMLVGTNGFNTASVSHAILARRSATASMQAIVETILDKAGYSSADHDVSALADVTVDGYCIDDPMTAAAALTPLQLAEPFDLVESDGVLKAVRRSAIAVAVIPSSERRATADEGKVQKEPESRVQELDLPAEVIVDVIDASRDYETTTQRARRQVTRGAKAVAKMTLPLVCTASVAKRIAEDRLFAAWAERDSLTMCLPRSWIVLDIGDVVQVEGRLMRVQRTQYEKGVVTVRGVFIPALQSATTSEADGGLLFGNEGAVTIASIPHFMDVPLLRGEDDQAGFYMAVGARAGWRGAVVLRSVSGVEYGKLTSFSTYAVTGVATQALPEAEAAYRDRANSLTVQLLAGELSSCDEESWLKGANSALVGDEIVQFRTAVYASAGCYVLSGLLRGRRGTTTGGHQAGERFVLLDDVAVQFMPLSLSDRNQVYHYRALSSGQSLNQVPDFVFTSVLATLQPLAPAHIKAVRSSGTGSECVLSWKRCARKNAEWVDYIDVPLDETAEAYDVEIMNGAVVMRSFTGLTSPTCVYTAAMQTADWGGSVPAGFTVNVYQVSPRYGRGKKASVSV